LSTKRINNKFEPTGHIAKNIRHDFIMDAFLLLLARPLNMEVPSEIIAIGNSKHGAQW